MPLLEVLGVPQKRAEFEDLTLSPHHHSLPACLALTPQAGSCETPSETSFLPPAQSD